MRFTSFNGDVITTQPAAPTELRYADAHDFIANDLTWSVAFDGHGDAWQVTYLDDPEVESASQPFTLPCFIGPAPA